MKTKLLLLVLLIPSLLLKAKESYEFIGIPITKIIESGESTSSEEIPKEKKSEFRCVISTTDGKYYWKTRENNEMVKVRSGIYITYIALNGSGYVRVIDQEMKKIVFKDGETKFDYKEHLISGLSSVTYYGITKQK
jgi:hypothetical protein